MTSGVPNLPENDSVLGLEELEAIVPPYLSYSQVEAWFACPRKYAYGYIEKMERWQGLALTFGTSFHAAAEAYHLDRNINRNRLNGIIDAVWEKEMERTVCKFWDKPVLMKNMCYRMVAAYIEWFDHPYPIVKAETEYIRSYDGFKVKGVVDFEDSQGLLGDLKTSAKPWTQEKADESSQPDFYGFVTEKKGDYPFEYWVGVKDKKKPYFQKIVTHRNGEESEDKVVGLCEQVLAERVKLVYPANTDNGGWGCSWCDYSKWCKHSTTGEYRQHKGVKILKVLD